MKKNNGFTLIELLAVIVILAIVALIATPIILDIIEESRKNANKDSVYGIIDAAKLYYAEHILSDSIVFDENGIASIKDEIKISGGTPKELDVKINNKGEVFVEALYNNMCFIKDYTSTEIIISEDGTCGEIIDSAIKPGVDGANIPTLTDNLVAVEISDTGVITAADTTNTNWYNYNENKWANAVILDGITPAVGQTISMDNIKQMYVWIPRFKYSNITTADKPITIEFVDKTVTEGVHVAFSLEGTGEISGIWVSKFELSEDYKIIPNVNSIHGKNVNELYNVIKTLNTGGSDNIHMFKNSEWGAVSYLSQSKYGICTELECNTKVQNNNYYESGSFNITTGCGGDDTSHSVTDAICPSDNEWNTQNGIKSSTTHNTSGIYDMAGGRWEYVMGIQYDSDTNDNLSIASSGFDQEFLNAVPSKFIDKYYYGTSFEDTDRNILGDATVETKEWNEDDNTFVHTTLSCFLRGGHALHEYRAGIWAYDFSVGTAGNSATGRAAIFGQ